MSERKTRIFGFMDEVLSEILANQRTIIANQTTLLERTRIMADTLTDLNNAVTQLITDETTAQSAILQDIAAFLATQPGGIDFTTQVTALQGVDAAITALPGQVSAALTPTPVATATSSAKTATASK